jgi:ribulose-phosphate 3-epimerase
MCMLGTDDPSRVIDAIHAQGMRAGISLRPNTGVETILPFLKDLDFVLVMTVEPGFGGQSFMADMMPKISVLRKASPTLDIGVDGGLSLSTVDMTTEVGANVIIAGTSVFTAKDRKEVIDGLRRSIKRAMPSW